MSTERTTSALRVLATQLGADGGLLAEALLEDDLPDFGPGDPGLGTLAAAGPRSLGREDEIALVVEAGP